MNAALETPHWLNESFIHSRDFFDQCPEVRDFQKKQRDLFLARGLPTKREELWKYTDLRFLSNRTFVKPSITMDVVQTIQAKHIQNSASVRLVFVNGLFSEKLSDVSLLPEDVICCDLKTAFKNHAEKIKKFIFENVDTNRFPFATLNAALMTDGIFLYIPKHTTMNVPIHILFANTEKNILTASRNIIVADENAQATILEEHCELGGRDYFTNVVTDIYAQPNSRIYYHKIQKESLDATHIAEIFVNQKHDSLVETYSLALGAQLGREDVWVNLNEHHTESSINGFYYLSENNQHIDNHAQVNHIAPLGTSKMVYKGVLEKKSRAVFNGKIYVYTNAQKTVSRQANYNLMLSPDAEVDTKPEFEIYADDVKCSHGDTVGQLDAEALFFLRSRGIEKKIALQMLTRAFAADVLNSIKNPAILAHMNHLLNEMFSDD